MFQNKWLLRGIYSKRNLRKRSRERRRAKLYRNLSTSVLGPHARAVLHQEASCLQAVFFTRKVQGCVSCAVRNSAWQWRQQ